MYSAIASGIGEHVGEEAPARLAISDRAEHGLSDAVLDETDALIWWGHVGHGQVDDQVVERVKERVLR